MLNHLKVAMVSFDLEITVVLHFDGEWASLCESGELSPRKARRKSHGSPRSGKPLLSSHATPPGSTKPYNALLGKKCI